MNWKQIPQRELKSSPPQGRSASFLQDAIPVSFLPVNYKPARLEFSLVTYKFVSLCTLKSFYSPQRILRMVLVATQFCFLFYQRTCLYVQKLNHVKLPIFNCLWPAKKKKRQERNCILFHFGCCESGGCSFQSIWTSRLQSYWVIKPLAEELYPLPGQGVKFS